MKETPEKFTVHNEDSSVFPHIFNADDINPNKHMTHEHDAFSHKSKMHDVNSIPKHSNRKPKQLQQRHQ